MGDTRKLIGGSAGFSLIEVMVSGGILAFIAMALLPAIFSVGDAAKISAFRAQCAAIVRAKLQDYMNGVADQTAFDPDYKPTGFEYTKRRFQQYGGAACSLTPAAGSPGFREEVFSNARVSATHREQKGDGQFLSRDLLGFQTWVMLRHYNPRVLTAGGQPARECPSNYSTYQFFRSGDAIEVTVTGMVRTRPLIANGGRAQSALKEGLVGKIGDLDDNTPNPLLTCSATEIVYPPRIPFRYYLAPDGKIINLQAKLAMNAGVPGSAQAAAEGHFRHVWSTPVPIGTYDSSVRTPQTNIRSFAVSPDNRWVWVMRPGQLARYGPCFEEPTAVTVNGVGRTVGGSILVNVNGVDESLSGMPDCPSMPSRANFAVPDGQTWETDSNIENITVDFQDLTDPTDDLVYGFPNSGSMSVTGVAGGQAGVLLATLGGGGGPIYTATWTANMAFTLPSSQPRIRGMFIVQTFPSVTAPNMFFFDNTCYTGGSTTEGDYRYCTSLFSSADSRMDQEMRELPIQLDAISH